MEVIDVSGSDERTYLDSRINLYDYRLRNVLKCNTSICLLREKVCELRNRHNYYKSKQNSRGNLYTTLRLEMCRRKYCKLYRQRAYNLRILKKLRSEIRFLQN